MATTCAARLAREAVLAPVTDGRLVTRTVRRLADAVNFSVFAVGQRLPPETELAERFGISVVTLRTALAVLRDAGCLATRRGRDGGTYVAERTAMPADLVRTVPELTPEYVQDLLGYALAIEPQAAALAAAHATPGDIAELEVFARRMAAAAELSEIRNTAAAFHIRLASCSRSLRLTRAEVDLQSELHALRLVEIHPTASGDHRAIVAAVGAGDIGLARSLMETHVSHGLSHLMPHNGRVFR